MTIWKAALVSFAVLVLGTVGYYGYSLFHFAHDPPDTSRFARFEQQEEDTGPDSPAPVRYEPPKWEGTERVNVLLLGGDSRGLAEHEIPRSDTIMIASIDPITKQAHLFSILRDTYVDIPGHGPDRINAAIVIGGPKLAMQTVSNLTGLNIQYYVFTDFQGFVKLVDEIGGIEFEVEKDMHYTSKADGPEYDIHLKKGRQHLNGNEALQYVRFRSDAMSDFARTERQRKLLMAIAQKLQTTSSVLRLPRILSAVDPYIETNMTVTEMLKLGALAFEANAREIKGVQLPPSNLLQEERIRGAMVLTVDRGKLQRFINEELRSSVHMAAPDHPDADGADGGNARQPAAS